MSHVFVTLAVPESVHIRHLLGPTAQGVRLAERGEPPDGREGRSWATPLTAALGQF